jgi:hypothetical protein
MYAITREYRDYSPRMGNGTSCTANKKIIAESLAAHVDDV